MLQKTHMDITREVMRKLEFTPKKEEFSALMQGVTAPDVWRNYPHHHGKNTEIENHLVTARTLFLQDDFRHSLYHLGIALHYIQDYYTTYPSSRLKQHDDWEEKIDKSHLVPDIEETIQKSIDAELTRRYYLVIAQKLSKDFQGRNDTLAIAKLNGQEKRIELRASPLVDFNLAFRASYVISNSVLSSKNCKSLDSQLENLHSRHERSLRAAEVETSNRILGLVSKRDKLARKKVSSDGVVPKIKNWLIEMRVRPIDKEAIFAKEIYLHRDHLRTIVNRYEGEARDMTDEHVGWYDFHIPGLDPSIVPLELLEIHSVSQTQGMDQINLKGSLMNSNVPIHLIGCSEIVKRSDFDGFLTHMAHRYDPRGTLDPQSGMIDSHAG